MSKKQKTRQPRVVPAQGSHGYSKVGIKARPQKIDEYHGLSTAIDKGYINFCLKKKNALGKKCNRKHLLPTTFIVGGRQKTVVYGKTK